MSIFNITVCTRTSTLAIPSMIWTFKSLIPSTTYTKEESSVLKYKNCEASIHSKIKFSQYTTYTGTSVHHSILKQKLHLPQFSKFKEHGHLLLILALYSYLSYSSTTSTSAIRSSLCQQFLPLPHPLPTPPLNYPPHNPTLPLFLCGGKIVGRENT